MTIEFVRTSSVDDEPVVMLIDDEYYSVRLRSGTIGYVYRADNVFVALEGRHFAHAYEVGQSLSLEVAIRMVERAWRDVQPAEYGV